MNGQDRIDFVRLGIQAAGLAAAGVALGLAVNAVNPRGVRLQRPFYAAAESGVTACVAPGSAVGRVAVPAAALLCNDCTVAFVDARTASDFAEGHVPGAVHLPPAGHPDEAGLLAGLRGKRTVVVYDDNSACQLADSVAHRLSSVGLADVRVLEGGWEAWRGKGEPAASGMCGACAGHGSGG